jgi:Restriction endonuclease
MQKPSMPVNTGIPYELLIRSIFQEILGQDKAKTIRVKQNTSVQGKLSKHQIDVLWTFSLGGITYTTIVQAKDWHSKIKKEHLSEFHDVLEDIPGQPRGVLVTRSGFQSGAKSLADKHGIKLYLLHNRQPSIKLARLGYFNITLDLQHRLFRMNVFNPEFSITLVVDEGFYRKAPSLPTKYDAMDAQIFEKNGTAIGTVLDILKSHMEEMQKSKTLSQEFTHAFAKDTYLKASIRSKKIHHLCSMKTTIKIIPLPEQTTPLLEPGIVCFILEDLEGGKQQVFHARP